MRSIGLVVPALGLGGGVPTVARFLYRIIEQSNRWRPLIISLATAANDEMNTSLLSPGTWFHDVGQRTGRWEGLGYEHVGARCGELEFQRYRPRRRLTRILRGCDLVQVVSGSPAWALSAAQYRGPIALQVATLSATERITRLAEERPPRRWWSQLMTWVATRQEHAALRLPDTIFVENRWMLEWIRQRMPNKRVLFAPPGVDTDWFRPSVYQPAGPILSVGRFCDRRKNVRLLFDAYARLRAQDPGVPKLAIAGSALPSADDLAYAASLELASSIELHHRPSPEELRALYQGASLFILSSDEEGLGMVLLEAMASALPVVATRCGGPETVVRHGETGFLTPVGDADALSNFMLELVKDEPLRRRMGSTARRACLEQFSFQAAGQPYLAEYARLLKS